MSFERQLSEAYAAKPKLAQVAAASPASPAAIVNARREDIHVDSSCLRAFDRFLICLALLLFYSLHCIG
jgi:hypothetical protein